ncbi:MAG: TetR/AcrR family transcriptional regulator [Rhizobiaceae bacterium]|jgi:AcrR family transcriptional regulator|nr:TetR/AcrR family transcriptional regulator [Rhizobiaceae bacterium]
MYDLVSLVNAGFGDMDDLQQMSDAEKRQTARRPAARSQDPDGTRRNILEIASEEFALNGLSGARVDEIAARTRSSKRMIYYYFGDKEGLYLSALENAYRRVREGEAALDIEGRPPAEALGRLVEFTFDHHHQHEEFIRMVMIENIHKGQYLDRSEMIRGLNATAIDRIAEVYARGVAEGVFRDGMDPVELHWQVSALCFFNVSNRATFSKIFGRDFGAPEQLERLRRNTVETIVRYVTRAERLAG